MKESIPVFRYHPDPASTGMVVASDVVCVCCDRARGYIYVGAVYSEDDLHDLLCPWCINDGSAAAKLDASFADSHSLYKAGLSETIISEVSLRTPAYIAWQTESWLSHCNDACEFHGHASVTDVSNASPETKQHWMSHYQQDDKSWLWATDGYLPKGDSSLYKFICRHCRQVLFGWDLS